MATTSEIRAIWRVERPLTLEDVRTSAHRSRTALPSTPKGFELAVLERLEDLDRQVDALRGIMATSWLTAQHSRDWYIGDATDEDWQMAYQAVDKLVGEY